MGSGMFDPGAYDDHIRAKAAAGSSTFDYSDAQTPGHRVVHPDLDPRWRNQAGQLIRESRDGDEHPEATPIVVVLDVTGTMGNVVHAIHASLKNLYGLLLTRGYVRDPQILFAAVGDSSIRGGRMCDEVPLQVAQFESDLRATLQLESMVIEGGGGGQKHESYQNAAYFLAEHTVHDAWEKRRKKGYVSSSGTSWPGRTSSRPRSRRWSATPPRPRSRRPRSSPGSASATTCSSSCRTAPASGATARCSVTGGSCSGRTSSSCRSRTAPPS